MTRKVFIADVQAAAAAQILGITSVARGADDSDVIVCFTPTNGQPIEITLMVTPDTASYPSDSTFMAWTDSAGVTPEAAKAIDEVGGISAGLRLLDLVTTISQKLTKVFATGSKNDPWTLDDEDDVDMRDASLSDEEPDQSDDEPNAYEDYGYETDHFGVESGGQHASASAIKMTPEAIAKLNKRIRQDLRAAKFAGFSVGILNGMRADSINSMLSLSIRVDKLGLSEEAIQAWDLEPKQYIILLIRYGSGYKTFDILDTTAAKSVDISFRVGVCDQYKPTRVEALAAFTDTVRKSSSSKPGNNDEFDEAEDHESTGFTNLFISSSLNDFINTQFISLLKIRSRNGVGWSGAKAYFNDKQGRMHQESNTLPDAYYDDTPDKDSNLPAILLADHLCDQRSRDFSIPLLAAQFCMRYLVRCTEFCLVCHDKIEDGFEALKPYVCSKYLCLYQYMSLGFGPSVEHEILTQPYVVDLLVSFCYASAVGRRLRESPTGMSLNVPPSTFRLLDTPRVNPTGTPPAVTTVTTPLLKPVEIFDVNYDSAQLEVMFEPALSCPVRVGDWIMVAVAGFSPIHHRVEEVILYPTIKLSPTVKPGSYDDITAVPTPATTPLQEAAMSARLSVYNQNFDDLDDESKAETIVTLLQTLPSITELRKKLLLQSRSSTPSLTAWKERVSPAALGILRWIIASNRSCIVQVDRCPGQDDDDVEVAKIRLDQRVSNVSSDWVQFRFAQGSPDKEQRFYNALKAQKEAGSLNVKYPTLWAWHGSPLANWHSIIRSGLDFKEVSHGRAYGNGVYHAIDQQTSISYAAMGGQGAHSWHGSSLRISTAMSLNEIVNCPTQFQSSNPFLVVQYIDWIQCRYLFVNVHGAAPGYHPTASVGPPSRPVNATQEVEQDPARPATTTARVPIGVPKCAATVSRAFRHDATSETPKSKRRKSGRAFVNTETLDSTFSEEDISDIKFLLSDDEDNCAKVKAKSKENVKPLTDFVAGSLDQSTLPMLMPPSNATNTATKSLQRALKEVLAIQEKTPLHDLGWYINPEHVSNLYQWIVEFHSFDKDLPLAKDMKLAGLTSIILEIRFGKDFPFSPPFVRVLRPRFLGFMNGGGGHVTNGGALCMELLTNSGWSSVSTIESVLLQVRMAISSEDPRPARLELPGNIAKVGTRDYGTGEAIEAYKRACAAHGWAVPPEFNSFMDVLPAERDEGHASGSGFFN